MRKALLISATLLGVMAIVPSADACGWRAYGYAGCGCGCGYAGYYGYGPYYGYAYRPIHAGYGGGYRPYWSGWGYGGWGDRGWGYRGGWGRRW